MFKKWCNLRGGLILFSGPTGCGKSTLLSIIAGLIKPEEGTISVHKSDGTLGYPKIGYMLQKDCLLEWRTILRNTLFGLEIKGMNTKVNYDMTKYTISISLENDGKGNLNSNIKYYDKDMNEVSKIEFNNVYIPNGLIIGNINTSDYVNKEIEFEYVLQLTNGVAGSYKVKNNSGEELRIQIKK